MVLIEQQINSHLSFLNLYGLNLQDIPLFTYMYVVKISLLKQMKLDSHYSTATQSNCIFYLRLQF